ncbi:MAG: hypothetical protein TU35_002850 [Thermoproteus sp. AZ2]|jgi:hypothetical protein|uniref:Uncharacterized protein n=1 Tax=Thermoproteus sp. AZ2 TaxID=1609232 RepID=A0ACC6V0N2_9CREN|nr:MAG: hypothetical protein TU35_00965 [Thermoproteus sp. AZ2]
MLSLYSAAFVPMFIKHVWTAIYSPKGRYPSGLAAKAIALYEAAFYALMLYLYPRPLALFAATALYAVVHLVGVPLYFGGFLAKYSSYGKAYSAFEASELVLLTALLISLLL